MFRQALPVASAALATVLSLGTATAGFPGFVVSPPPPAFDLKAFQAEFEAAAKDAWVISEGDYQPEFLAKPLADPNAEVTGQLVFDTFADDVAAFIEGEFDGEPLDFDLAFAAETPEGTRAMLADWATIEEHHDEFDIASAKAFQTINQMFAEELTGVTAVKIGEMIPEDASTSFFGEPGTLGMDRGLYGWVVVGKTPTGELVGFLVGVVET